MMSSSSGHGLGHVSTAQHTPPQPSKQEVTIDLFSGEPDGFHWGVDDFIAFLEGLKAKVPKCATSTSARLTSESSYGESHNPVLTVSYNRMETDEEFSARLGRLAGEEARQKEREIRQMEELMKKHLRAGVK